MLRGEARRSITCTTRRLYRAIGEPDNRHRRPATVARAIERLMVLDAVLAARQLTWLATEREKVAYFVEQRHSAPTISRL